jgi:hypothetical protein
MKRPVLRVQMEQLCKSVDHNDVTSPSQIFESLEFLQCPMFGN